jgi:uncharacterized oxidoreductase
MQITSNTILVTGGGSGIGLALAKRFAARGNRVIISGRRAEKLAEAKRETPALETLQGDVATEAGRTALAHDARTRFPALNVLVNNAGVQNRPAPLLEPQDWSAHKAELATNLEAPMHLTMLLLPHLAKAAHGAVVNVTSGLAFAPFAIMPTYCLTKAAMHSFTLSLRHQLKATKLDVVEIIPPAVNTDLGGPGLHTFGVNVEAFADGIFARLDKGETEIGYETSELRRLASRPELDAYFAQMNAPQS